jgi:hypothetical protein
MASYKDIQDLYVASVSELKKASRIELDSFQCKFLLLIVNICHQVMLQIEHSMSRAFKSTKYE